MMKTIQAKFNSLFETKKETQARDMKELLRENLDLIPVDIFYIDDPRVGIPPDKVLDYDKKFYDICRDKDVMDRIKFLINKQALITINGAKEGKLDALGGININGMATIKDDFTRLGNSYLKSIPNAEPFNSFKII